MTDGVTESPSLIDEATKFAADLTGRLQQVLDTPACLNATALGDRVIVQVEENGVFAPVPLKINGKQRLNLTLKFFCCWDSRNSYLALDESLIHVYPTGKAAHQLFRYEYVRSATRSFPCSHLHVHAHRDEFTYLLSAADRGRPGRRHVKDDIPRLSEFHFPLGGHRFRPCMEDVLQALIEEFQVDAREGWRTAVAEGREQWRRLQLKAAVRDAPHDAAKVLKELGWDPIKPPDKPVEDNIDRLRAY